MPFTLPALSYAHDALEPHFDTLTMQIHHGKHHQAYVDNLNKAIAGTPHEGKSIEELVAQAGSISMPVRNNGGGHWNHTFFWESLAQTLEELLQAHWQLPSMQHSDRLMHSRKSLPTRA
jgi:Fe-Mn family superoxide dismutase